MKISVVLGAGFGDEGKGRTVSYLSSLSEKTRKCVVRFNGGHQAGHTVIYNGIRHVFSSFASGTLQGVPTYWSKYCTVYPVAFINEYLALDKLGIKPTIYINELSPITTPFDVEANRNCVKYNKDGTCGVGFGKTIERHQKIPLYFSDLFNETVFIAKLENIEEYYRKNGEILVADQKINLFIRDCRTLIQIVGKEYFNNFLLLKFSELIFEGAQGILLDRDFGFAPNTTWSNTTSQNVIEILREIGELENNFIDIYYITRTYQTRHGNGFMSDERKLDLKNNKNETNVFNNNQGNFRTGNFDKNLFDYAIKCDNIIHRKNKLYNINKKLVITCVDQMEDSFDYREIYENKVFDDKYFLYMSIGPETEKMLKRETYIPF